MTIHFTLHTEPKVGPPQFTISYQTHGGPATEVSWFWNRRKRLTKIVTESKYVILMQESQNHSVYIETSRTILDTSYLSEYENKLLVRGRVGGEFTCSIKNTFYSLLRTNTTTITGINDHVCCILSTSLLRYSGRGTERTYRCHLFLQQYTCQYHCVLLILSLLAMSSTTSPRLEDQSSVRV